MQKWNRCHHSLALLLLLTCMTDFLPQTTKRDVSQSLYITTASFFIIYSESKQWLKFLPNKNCTSSEELQELKNVKVLVLKMFTNIHVSWLWLQPFWPSETCLAMWNVSLKACVQINVFMWCVVAYVAKGTYMIMKAYFCSLICTLDGAWALCIKPQSFSSNMTAWLQPCIIFYTIHFKLTYNPFTSEMTKQLYITSRICYYYNTQRDKI